MYGLWCNRKVVMRNPRREFNKYMWHVSNPNQIHGLASHPQKANARVWNFFITKSEILEPPKNHSFILPAQCKHIQLQLNWLGGKGMNCSIWGCGYKGKVCQVTLGKIDNEKVLNFSSLRLSLSLTRTMLQMTIDWLTDGWTDDGAIGCGYWHGCGYACWVVEGCWSGARLR